MRVWLYNNLRRLAGSGIFLGKMAWYFLMALMPFALLYIGLSSQDFDITDEAKAFELISRMFVFVAAGAFFLYKVGAGFHFVNASIDIEAQRSPDPEGGDDFLAISVSLSRGGGGTLVLRSLSVRVKAEDGVEILKPTEVSGTERIESKSLESGNWDVRSSTSPQLHLAPSESARLSHLTRVPKGIACVVETALSGRRVGFPAMYLSQWRASTVSLPLSTSDSVPILDEMKSENEPKVELER